MKFMKAHLIVIVTAMAVAACSSSDDDDSSPGTIDTDESEVTDSLFAEGSSITLRNTLEEGGPEGSFPGLFGLPDDSYDELAILSYSESEFPTALAQPGSPAGDISGLYAIDFSEQSIEYRLLPAADDPFWSGVFGVFPMGKFDRYYFTFSEPHGITSGVSSNSSVTLRIDSETVIVVQISEGYDMAPGVSFSINIE